MKDLNKNQLANISLTDIEIENVADSLRQNNFEIPCEWDNETIARLIEAVLNGLNIEK